MILTTKAICKSQNGGSGSGMRGMVGMREIKVGIMEMQGIRVGMWGIRVGMMEMWGIRVGMWGRGVGMRGGEVGMRGRGVEMRG